MTTQATKDKRITACQGRIAKLHDKIEKAEQTLADAKAELDREQRQLDWLTNMPVEDEEVDTTGSPREMPEPEPND